MTKAIFRSLLLLQICLTTFSASAQHARLKSTQVGTSATLLSTGGNGTSLDVNNTLGTIVFVHRNDPSLFEGNSAQLRYDISTTKGFSWRTDIGPITTDPPVDNQHVYCRFPQGAIFNPPGNTIADSAYLIYSSTWHDGINGWKGETRGRGKLSGELASFNVHVDSVNQGAVAIGTSFCQSTPGTFWNINQDYPANSFISGAKLVTKGIIVEKGVWNSVTKDVDWTEKKIPQTFLTNILGNTSIAVGFNIAFDPSGQYGWISCVGDIYDSRSTQLNPIFWRSTDGGDTWIGPEQVRLDSMPEIVEHLYPTQDNGNPSSHIPTTTFEGKLLVDYLGDPHFEIVVANSTGDYEIQKARYTAWDITCKINSKSDTIWKGNFLGNIQTLRGAISSDFPAPQTQDNRLIATSSPDRKKLFFFWVDSDIYSVGSDDNTAPNLFGRALDVEAYMMTDVINFSEGDSLWGGKTQNSPSGVYGGVVYPVAGTSTIRITGGYNVPMIFSQADYNHDPSTGWGSYLNPAAYWYISNINIADTSFNLELPHDTVATVGLNGNIDAGNTMTVNAWPNPFTTNTIISVKGINDKYNFELYDIRGQMNIKLQAIHEKQFQLNRSNLASGIYFYRVETPFGKTAFGKLILE